MSLIRTIQSVISVFENGSPKLVYDYVSNEHDGRGYTAGIAGWTTADNDYQNIVSKYSPLSKYKSTSTLKLMLTGYPAAWKNACKDPAFLKLQDDVQDSEYFQPAILLAEKLAYTTPIAKLIFCDTNIQHGFDGPDSLSDIAYKVRGANEIIYLQNFLQLRKMVLQNPQDPSTKDEWAQSVGRADALMKLLTDGNMNLTTPFSINPWDDDQAWVITG